MYQIGAAAFAEFMEVLNSIPDVDDIIVKNKKISIESNSNHIITADLASLDIPECEFEFIQFKQVYQTLKILTNFSLDIEYGIDDNEVIFLFSHGKFQFDRGHIQNTWITDEQVNENNYLFSIPLENSTFNKIKRLIALYKAFPTLELKNGKIFICFKPRSNDRSIDIEVSDSNLFGLAGIETENLTLTLTPVVFLYPIDTECVMKFYSDDHGYTIKSEFTVRNIPFTYTFSTDEEEDEFTSLDGISGSLESLLDV